MRKTKRGPRKASRRPKGKKTLRKTRLQLAENALLQRVCDLHLELRRMVFDEIGGGHRASLLEDMNALIALLRQRDSALVAEKRAHELASVRASQRIADLQHQLVQREKVTWLAGVKWDDPEIGLPPMWSIERNPTVGA